MVKFGGFKMKILTSKYNTDINICRIRGFCLNKIQIEIYKYKRGHYTEFIKKICSNQDELQEFLDNEFYIGDNNE